MVNDAKKGNYSRNKGEQKTDCHCQGTVKSKKDSSLIKYKLSNANARKREDR